jgi:hypothetical protein
VTRKARVLDEMEVERIATETPDRYWALMWTLAVGDLRIEEATVLRVGDLDLKAAPPAAEPGRRWRAVDQQKMLTPPGPIRRPTMMRRMPKSTEPRSSVTIPPMTKITAMIHRIVATPPPQPFAAIKSSMC